MCLRLARVPVRFDGASDANQYKWVAAASWGRFSTLSQGLFYFILFIFIYIQWLDIHSFALESTLQKLYQQDQFRKEHNVLKI